MFCMSQSAPATLDSSSNAFKPNAAGPGSKRLLQGVRKNINSCSKLLPERRNWGSRQGLALWKGFMGRTLRARQLLMSSLQGLILFGWRRGLPSERRNVQRHCRQSRDISPSQPHNLPSHPAGRSWPAARASRAHRSKACPCLVKSASEPDTDLQTLRQSVPPRPSRLLDSLLLQLLPHREHQAPSLCKEG